MRLTDSSLRKLQPKTSQYDLRERDGFGLRVSPAGSKSFTYTYTLNGRRVRLTIGTWPTLSLPEARKAHAQARALVTQGICPRAQRETAKREARAGIVVSQLVSDYIDRWAKPRKRTWREDQRVLLKHVVPLWGSRPANSIRRGEVIDFVNGLVDVGMGVGANRILSVIVRMFNWAIEQDILETSPCFRVRPPAPQVARDRILSDSELTLLLGVLDGPEKPSTKRVLLFQLYTAQRVREACEASWAEIDGDWWTIPSARSKNGRAHRVPLTEPALALLAESRQQHPGSPWCFPSRDERRPTSKSGVMAVVKDLRDSLPFQGRWTSHDLRRTAASLMARLGTSRTVVGQVLNHTDPSVTAIYDRYGYEKEKREALQLLADFLIRKAIGRVRA